MVEYMPLSTTEKQAYRRARPGLFVRYGERNTDQFEKRCSTDWKSKCGQRQ
jgi:hypothetical protein